MFIKTAPRALPFAGRSVAVVMILICLPVGASHASALSREAAISLAIERDLEIAQSRDRESMQRATARVSAALPPPSLTLSAMNLPVDGLALDQEPMTQLQVRLSQMLPPGDSRRWRAINNERQADAWVLERELRSAQLTQRLRMVWADGWLAQASLESLEANRVVFEQALATTRASYGAGIRLARQREVLGAQAALTRLEERIERFSMLLDTTREQFAEWLTPAEVSQLDFTHDPLPHAEQSSSDFELEEHPAMVLARAQQLAVAADAHLADELGKGSRGISLSYGYREDPASAAERVDFLSVGFTMDLAGLRGGANAARRAAADHQLEQADKAIALQRVRLLRDHRQNQATLARVNARLALYRDALLPQYRQQAEATRRAFASDEARFIEVQLVLIDLLNAELESLALNAEHMKASATRTYLQTQTASTGESR